MSYEVLSCRLLAPSEPGSTQKSPPNWVPPILERAVMKKEKEERERERERRKRRRKEDEESADESKVASSYNALRNVV